MAGIKSGVSLCIAYIALTLVQGRETTQLSVTCSGLDQFIENTDSSLSLCRKDQNCTMVKCDSVAEPFSLVVSSTKSTLLPCTEPPSIRLQIFGTGGEENVLLNEILYPSNDVQEVQFPSVISNGATIDVIVIITLMLNQPCEFGIEVGFQEELEGKTVMMTVNRYTLIRLDTSSCSSPPSCATDTSSNSTTKTAEVTPACNDSVTSDAENTARSTTVITTSTSSSTSSNTRTSALAVISVVASLILILVLTTGIVLVIVLCMVRKSRRFILNHSPENEKQATAELPELPEPVIPVNPVSSNSNAVVYVPSVNGTGTTNISSLLGTILVTPENVQSDQIPSTYQLIPRQCIQLMENIGQGKFGIVYRGNLVGWQESSATELVAVKTLKNIFSTTFTENLEKERKTFEHPNILSLIGVCVDTGEAPYIIMPFMTNGSLLTYLKRERPYLTIAKEAGYETFADAQRKLLSICLQIVKGMSYLAAGKFVHGDLAARNCMIDHNLVIKISDYGMSEDIYSRNCLGEEQGEEDSIVPIRWMALESVLEDVFTEKTDVWSYGVTCWEVFTLGHTPYSTIHPSDLINYLKTEERLEKPTNAACTFQVYDLMAVCWNEIPDRRPYFENLLQEIDLILEGVAGYIDFSEFFDENLARYTDFETDICSGYYH